MKYLVEGYIITGIMTSFILFIAYIALTQSMSMTLVFILSCFLMFSAVAIKIGWSLKMRAGEKL